MGLTGPDEHVSIAHCKGFIDIDRVLACGVSSQRLGCLRLEDMKGFYLIEISRPATMAGSFCAFSKLCCLKHGYKRVIQMPSISVSA